MIRVGGYWACMFCGTPVDEHGWDSRCCGEIDHTEYVEDEGEEIQRSAIAEHNSMEIPR